MNFVFRHLKSFVYLAMAVFAIGVGALQLSTFYKNKKFIKTADEIGFIATAGRNVVVKGVVSKQQFIPTNGAPLFSGDVVLTYDHTVEIEFPAPFDKVRILPYSEISFLKKGSQLQVYVQNGDVSVLSRNRENSEQQKSNLALYKKNEQGQFDEHQPTFSHLASGKIFHVTNVQQKQSQSGFKLQLSWDITKLTSNAWVELWVGTSQATLIPFKSYPFEQGQISELISAEQYYWTVKVKQDDQVIDTTPISFWKNDFVSQVNLLYPNDDEVINDYENSEGFSFKWAQAANVTNPVLKVYSDEQQTKLVDEITVDGTNFQKYVPKSYGQYFWKVVDNTQRIQSELRTFHFAPLVPPNETVVSWNELTEEKQFYYDESIAFVKWNKTYPYPVNKYKITFQYFQRNKQSGQISAKTENIFSEKTELYFNLTADSPVKVRIQPYNYKMQRLGKYIEKTIELEPRQKNRMLVFYGHLLTPKKEFISDRKYSFNFDTTSVSALYKYNFLVSTADKTPVRSGAFYKGGNLNLTGLPVNYYNVQFSIEPRKLENYFESLYLEENPSRKLASEPKLNLIQTAKVKLIPPVDYNIDKDAVNTKTRTNSKILTPQVPNVQIKE